MNRRSQGRRPYEEIAPGAVMPQQHQQMVIWNSFVRHIEKPTNSSNRTAFEGPMPIGRPAHSATPSNTEAGKRAFQFEAIAPA